MSIRIAFLGEIIGRPGIHALKTSLKALRERERLDYVVANAEGATYGFGIGKNHALQLLKLGVDLLTTGEKTYYKIDMVEHIAVNSRILRPANYPPGTPGRGYRIVQIKDRKAAFLVLLGNSNFPRTHVANPFLLAPSILEKVRAETPLVFVQFHASTTAEKGTMAYALEGKSTAVIGTHTKVLTADARILPRGTAMVTDNGRCGSTLGIGGFDPACEIQRHLTQIPSRSKECWDRIEIQGVIVEAEDDGKASSIEYIRLPVASPQVPEGQDQ